MLNKKKTPPHRPKNPPLIRLPRLIFCSSLSIVHAREQGAFEGTKITKSGKDSRTAKANARLVPAMNRPLKVDPGRTNSRESVLAGGRMFFCVDTFARSSWSQVSKMDPSFAVLSVLRRNPQQEAEDRGTLKDGKLSFPFRIEGTIENPKFLKGTNDK